MEAGDARDLGAVIVAALAAGQADAAGAPAIEGDARARRQPRLRPAATTSPTASTPTVIGKVRLAKAMPRKPQRSIWLRAIARTRTWTSSGPGGGGSSTSTSASSRSASSRSACIFAIVPPIAARPSPPRARHRPAAPPRDIGGGIGQEEADHGRHLLGPGIAAGRDLLLQPLAMGAVAGQHLGIDEAGRDVVRRHALARHLLRQRPQVAQRRRLRGRVDGIAAAAGECCNRADDDDPPAARRRHRADQGLGDARHRPEIHLHHRLGLGLVDHGRQPVVAHPGIVDEGAIAGADRLLGQGIDRRTVGEVAGDRPARPVARATAVGIVDLPAGCGELGDDGRADSAAAARHQNPPLRSAHAGPLMRDRARAPATRSARRTRTSSRARSGRRRVAQRPPRCRAAAPGRDGGG